MNGKTILLVEDDAIIAMSEAVVLEQYGARVITVYSAEQAIETFAATPEIDLVLIDIDLGRGNMDGIQAAELILQQRELPVIFLSCHTERGVVERTESITTYGYIVKRSGQTALVDSVKMAFRLFESRQQALESEKALQESEARLRLAMTATGAAPQTSTEEALRKSEKKYRSVVDGLSEGVVLQDRSGAIITGNRAAAAILGLDQDQILGLNSIDQRWQAIHEDGSPFPGEMHPAMVTLRTGQPQREVVMGVCRPDGALVWISINSQMVSIEDDEGQPDTVLVSFTDITARKQAEDALRAKTDEIEKFFSSALDLLCIADTGGHFLHVNREWSNVLGYPPEELEGRLFLDFVHPDDMPATLAALADLDGKKTILNFTNRYRSRDGSYRWIEWRSVPADNGRIYAAARDITERMNLEKAMQQAYNEKRDLLRELQHRAKNSFLMITGMINLMRDTNHSDEARAALDEAGARVMALTNLYDLLYASDAVTQVRLDSYCAKVLGSFPFPSNVQIAHTYDPVTVQVRIAAPLGLILTELLTNAVKHAFPEGRRGTLTVSLRQAGEQAILQVEDNGVGLPPGFDPIQSHGLGLTLVQALAGQIRGSFQIEHIDGTRCVVQFPC